MSALEIVVAGTDPYPWPFAGLPPASRLALIVAGADDRWIARSGDGALSAAEHITTVAAALRAAGGTVVHVVHDAPARSPGTGRPAVLPAALREHDDLVVAATGIDGFFGSALDRRLRDAACDHLLLAGFGLEAPVHSTLRSANDRGYECLLLTDASASLDPTIAAAALSMVTMSGGIFGALGTSRAVLTALHER